MSKKCILLLFCLVISAGLYAAEKVNGQIVFSDRTIDVTLFIPVGLFGTGPNTEALQKGVRYLDPKGKKRRLKPNQAKEFRFNFEGQEFRMVSHPYEFAMFAMASHVFLLQLIDGPLKMFEYRVTTQNSGGPNMTMASTQTISYLLQKTGEEGLVEPRVIGFKKEMSEYFADCPSLVALIQEKEFKRRDLSEIVMFYNTRCTAN